MTTSTSWPLALLGGRASTASIENELCEQTFAPALRAAAILTPWRCR